MISIICDEKYVEMTSGDHSERFIVMIHHTSYHNTAVQTKMSNISRFLLGLAWSEEGGVWHSDSVVQVVDGMKLYDMLCKNMHVSQQVAGGVWDIDLENNDFPIIATGLLFPVLILPKQSRPGCRHHHLSSPTQHTHRASSLYPSLYQSHFDTIKCISIAGLPCLSQLQPRKKVEDVPIEKQNNNW